MTWLLDALQTPRMSGFVVPHFGQPFGTNRINPAVFVHGHFLNLALRYREATGNKQYDPLIHRVASALNESFTTNKQGVLKSYRDMWWLSDNLPALSALARYDRQFQRDTSGVRTKFLRNAKEFYQDPSTGLLCTYVDADQSRQLQGPRGISTMYGLHFLRDFVPEFAEDQYRRARQQFVREAFGLAAVREFPEGIDAKGDIDSGPLLFGFGPSASGFAIAAAAVMGDRPAAEALLRASALAGLPQLHGDELSYTTMPPVGQAVILFGKTELLKLQASRSP